MVAQVLDGKEVSQALLDRLAERIQKAPKLNLTTVVVGQDPRSRLYINLKLKKAKQVGMDSQLIELPETVSQDEMEQVVNTLSADKRVHGILVQLPLPKGLDTQRIIERIVPEKDVDGLSQRNMGALLRHDAGLVPCTPLGVMRILEHYRIPTKGQMAVVIGRSYLVGLPQMVLLTRRGVDATVTLCHSATARLDQVCRQADILISAVGQAEMITADFVKPSAVLIDVGVSQVGDEVKGDLDYDSVCQVASAVTPMPGGTGPVTVACLIENTWRAAKLQGVV